MGFLKNLFDKTMEGKLTKGSLISNEIIDDLYKGSIYNDENKINESIRKTGPKAEKISPFEKPGNYRSPFGSNDEKQEPEISPSDQESMNGTSKYMQIFNKSHKPEFDILLKPERNINTPEIMAASKFSKYDSNDRDLNHLLNNKISSWYGVKYGTEPVKRDATGRQIEPEEKFRDSADTIAPRTREGLDLGEGLKRVSQHMSVVDDDDTPETGVNALQKSINRLGVQPPLKEDGILGPKTALQTRMFLANNGYDTLDKAFNNRLYRRNTQNDTNLIP